MNFRVVSRMDNSEVNAFLLGSLLGIVLGGLVLGTLVEYAIHQTASTTSCAQYNPVTGDFEWISEQNAN